MIGCATMPGRLLRIAVQKLTPSRRQTASSTPRSTQRVAEAGDERRQAELAAGAQLVAVVVGVEIERRSTAAPRGRPRPRPRSTSELVLVLRVESAGFLSNHLAASISAA